MKSDNKQTIINTTEQGSLREEIINLECAFLVDLQNLLNRYIEKENGNISDSILAQYLNNCLTSYSQESKCLKKLRFLRLS